MTALDDWIKDARAGRRSDLIYFNYVYETTSPPLTKPYALSQFDRHLNAKVGVRATYGELLDDFVRNTADAKLAGPAISFNRTVVSIFSLLKIAKVFGLTPTLASYASRVVGLDPAALDRHASAELSSLLDRLRPSAIGSTAGGATRTAGGRSVRSTRRGAGFDKHFAPDTVLWVTKHHAAKPLSNGLPVGPSKALLIRRVLGLPTMHPPWPGASATDQVLGNLFYRVSFRLRRRAARDVYRKPTVFSGGFADIYGSFKPNPPSDGWGRTITLCAGDADDGSEGLPEAVVQMAELMATAVVRLGRVDPVHQPKAWGDLVDTEVFAEKRHRDELGMDIS